MAGKNQQIKNIRIKVETKGSTDAAKDLDKLNATLERVVSNTSRLDKEFDFLADSASSIAGSMSRVESAVKTLGTAMRNSGTKKGEKELTSYMESMELVNLTLMETTKHANTAGDALSRVNNLGGMSKTAEATNHTAAAMDELLGSVTDIVLELKELNVGSKVATARLKGIREGVEQTGVYANRTTEELEGMTHGFKGMGGAADKLNPKLKETDNRLKNLNGRGSQGARAFSKMAFGMNPLTTLYAKLAINIYALTEAFRLLGEFSNTNRLIENLGVMSSQSGVHLSALSKEMIELSGASLSFAESSRLAARSVAQGFSSDQMLEMTKNAKKASIALGINFSDAMERLTKGIAKQEVELLDELGIVTRLEPAMKKYADSMGKTVTQLTDSERTTALYIEANRQLASSFDQVSIAATGVEVFTKAVSNAMTAVGIQASKFLDKYLKDWGEAINEMFVDPQRDADEFVKSLDATIMSVNNFGKAGKVANAFRIGNILGDGAKLADKERAGLDALIVTREKAKRQLLRYNQALENIKKHNNTENRDDALKAASERLQTASTAFGEATSAVYKAETAISTVGDAIAEAIEKLDLEKFSFEELKAMSTQFKSLQESTQNSTVELSKWNTSLLDTRGPLNLMIKSLSAAASEYESLKAKVEENPALLQDLFRLEAKTLASVNKQFGTTFKDLDKALVYVRELNKELYEFSDTMARIGIRGGMSSLEINATKLDAITAFLEANSANLGVIQKTALMLQRDRLQLSVLQDAGKEKMAKDTTDKAVIDISDKATGEVAAVARQERSLQLSMLLLETERAHNIISNAEYENQKKILDSKLKQLELDKQAAVLRDAASSLSAVQALSGLSELQDIGLGMAENFTSTFAAAKEAGMGFSEFLMSSAEAFQDFSISMANAANSIFQNISDAKIAGIDREIAAEQKRDGKSKESLAKIKKLEAEKIKAKAKSDKAQLAMSTAVAIMNAYKDLPYPANIAASVAIAALGAMQMSNIDKAAGGSMAAIGGGGLGNMKITGGNRDNSIDVSKSANAGELSFLQGGMGQGTANNFNTGGRAGGGFSEAGTSVMVGERGPEMITPQVPINVATAGESKGMGGNLTFAPVFNANAVDAAGMEELFKNYSKELYDGLEAELNANSQSLENVG